VENQIKKGFHLEFGASSSFLVPCVTGGALSAQKVVFPRVHPPSWDYKYLQRDSGVAVGRGLCFSRKPSVHGMLLPHDLILGWNKDEFVLGCDTDCLPAFCISTLPTGGIWLQRIKLIV
jgi:hypothetical protein